MSSSPGGKSMASKPLERTAAKSDTGVRLISPPAVAMTREVSALNSDSDSMAVIFSLSESGTRLMIARPLAARDRSQGISWQRMENILPRLVKSSTLS